MEVFLLVVLVHWIADFIFQDERWALGESKNLIPLLSHTCVYSLIWLIPVWLFTNDFSGAFMFMFITFISHTTTDYFTSKVVSKKFADKHMGGPIPNLGAFTTIGFDQVLHYAQLIITWKLLFGGI